MKRIKIFKFKKYRHFVRIVLEIKKASISLKFKISIFKKIIKYGNLIKFYKFLKDIYLKKFQLKFFLKIDILRNYKSFLAFFIFILIFLKYDSKMEKFKFFN